MQRIQQNRIRKWTKVGDAIVPIAVRERCPRCDDMVIFTFENYQEDKQRHAAIGYAACPGCDKLITIVVISAMESPFSLNKSNSEYYIYPSPLVPRSVATNTDGVPEALIKALHSTEDSYAAKNYVATAVGARRTLEGIFKYLVTDEERTLPLAQLIRKARDKADLAAPLTALSEAIRDGGNLGAHFDPDAEPTQEIALQMVELLKYLTEYLYVLPVKIRSLEMSLGKTLPPEQSESASSD